MGPDASGGLRRPRADDRALWSIVMGIYGYQAVLLAHDLKLFSALARGARSLEEVAGALGIERRPSEALLAVCAALGLVALHDGKYSLTPLSEDYLIESSPTYFGGFLDFTIANRSVLAFDSLKAAIVTNAPQVYGGADLFESHEAQADLAREFTRMMHSHSMAPALAWPEAVDLSSCRSMLDVGGGSGAHSIGAALRWPELRATVLDMPSVCEAAEEYIARYGLSSRIRAERFDLWSDPLPPADLHFYSDIFHDHPPEKCEFLARKSFEGLLPGGRILIHEMLLEEGKTGPFPVAAYNASMLVWTRGQQFTGTELVDVLTRAGFRDAEVIPTFGFWHVVMAEKA